MHYKMTPGDSRTFKRKQKQAMVLAVGVWAEFHEGETQIHIAGNDNFHVIVVDHPDTKRYHPTLFRHLRQVLLDNGCWAPPEKESLNSSNEARSPVRIGPECSSRLLDNHLQKLLKRPCNFEARVE
jgi:hypothetical protein